MITRTGVTQTLNNNVVTNPGNNGDAMFVGYIDDELAINPLTKPSDFVQVDYQYIGGDGANTATFLAKTTTSGSKTFQSAFDECLCVATYSGVHQTNPVNAHTTSKGTTDGSGNLTSFAIPAITTTKPGCRLLVFVAPDLGSPGISPTYAVSGGSLTKIADVANEGTPDWVAGALFEDVLGAAGSTSGVYTLSVSNSSALQDVGVFVVALAPAVIDVSANDTLDVTDSVITGWVLQIVDTTNTGLGTTQLQCVLTNVQEGSYLHAFVGDLNTGQTITLSDDKGSEWSLGLDNEVSSTAFYRSIQFSALTGGTGTVTVTATWTSSTNFHTLVVAEIGGVYGLVSSAGSAQGSVPADSTDGVIAGPLSYSDPSLILGYSLATDATPPPVHQVPGTGFTDLGQYVDYGFGFQGRLQFLLTSTPNVSSTFTSGSGPWDFLSLAAAYAAVPVAIDVDVSDTLAITESVVAGKVFHLGKDTVGGNTDGGNGSLALGQQAVLTTPGILQSLSFYVLTAVGDLNLGVATASGSQPGTEILETGTFTPTTGWNTVAVPDTPLSAGTYYLIHSPTSNSLEYKYDSDGSYSQEAVPPGEITFPWNENHNGTANWSFYATLFASPSLDIEVGDTLAVSDSSLAIITAGGSTPVYQVNAGPGSASPFIAQDGFVFGGNDFQDLSPIDMSGVTDPAPEFVYQSEHYGDQTWTFPSLTPGSTYTVRLHFCEIYPPDSFPGGRVFNVDIQGSRYLDSYDLYAHTGGPYIATVEQTTAVANEDGEIVIDFITLVDNAKVSGIEILTGAPSGQTIEVNLGPTVIFFGGTFA